MDHGATTPVDQRVVEAMLPYFTEKYGNASSLHSLGSEAAEALEESRKVLAESINAKPEEIVFTSGGSESDNLALKGIIQRKEKGHIITTQIEHPAVLETCRSLERGGCIVTYLDVDEEGFVSLEELDDAIKEDTVMVSIIHGNNEIGTIQNLGEIGGVCGEHYVVFHTDAIQSHTKTEVDVRKQKIGLASFSAHKIHGPKGVGALYVQEDLMEKMVKQNIGGHHEHDLRAGTENIPGIVGYAKAVSLSDESHIKHMTGLRDRLMEGLLELPETLLNGPRGERRLCNNVNTTFRFVEGESILLRLDNTGIYVSTGSACSSKSLTPSHVLTAIGRSQEDSHGSMRFSLGRDNTVEEIDYALESVREVVGELRRLSPRFKG